jgi:SAM-dependent methyltransferase
MSSLLAPPARTGLGARLRLARRILAIHYVQPATALWRLFEVEVVLEHLRGRGRGLDLGCGDGTLATVLLSRTPDIRWTGLDVDPRDAARAHRRGLYEHIHVASASAIPERDRAFDLVFSNSALEHMDGLDAVLGEVRRVLRPGGRFVFTVPEPGFHASLFWPRLLRGLGGREAAARYVRHLDRRVAHVNYLSPEQWLERLSRHDLQGDLVVPYLSKRAVGWWETLANATGGLAYLAAGERMTPRQIQQASGLLEREHPSLGTVAFVALLPVLLLTASERHPRQFGCLYVEATRRA